MGFLPIPYHAAAAPDFRGTAPVALARQWLSASDIPAETLAFLPVICDDMAPTLTVGTLALIDNAIQRPMAFSRLALTAAICSPASSTHLTI
jgi:hypothetical protein